MITLHDWDKMVSEGDVEGAARAETLAALTWLLHGERGEADQHMERALDLVRELPPSAAKAEVLVEHARLSMLAAEQERAVRVGEEGLAMADALGLERLQASVLITIGTARGNRGEFDEGIEQLQRGLELALRIKEPQHVQRGYNNLAQLRSKLGEYERVPELYVAARGFVEEYGLGGLRWIAGQQATVAHAMGDWATAQRLTDDFLDTAAAAEPHYMDAQVRVVHSQLRYAYGDVDGALDEAQQATVLGRRARDPQVIGTALAAHATLLLEERRGGEAARLTDELAGLRNADGGFAYFTWIVPFAWLAHDLDRTDPYRELAEHETPKTPLVMAGSAIVDGSFADAADLLAPTGLRTHEAYARLRAAEQLTSEGRTAEAADQRDRALAFYRSVGASMYVRRAEALLPASA